MLMFCTNNKLFSQTKIPEKDITQSVYYDALSICYAQQGFWAYVIINSSEGDLESGSSNTNDNGDDFGSPNLLGKRNDSPVPKVKKPNVKKQTKGELNVLFINSLNGQVLQKGDYTEDQILSILNANYFDADGDTTSSIINDIFTKKANLKDGDDIEKDINNAYNAKAGNYYDAKFLIVNTNKKDVDSKRIKSFINYDSRLNTDTGGASKINAGFVYEGIADFLITQVNKEIDILAISNLMKFFEKNWQLQTLFPKTYNIIENNTPENFIKTTHLFKSAFQEDLQSIVTNTGALADVSKMEPIFAQQPELYYFFTILKIAGQLQKRNTAAGTLHEIYCSPYLYYNTTQTENIVSLLKFTGLLSEIMLDKRMGDDDDLKWLDKNKILVFHDPSFFRIFMSLVLQTSPDIEFVNIKGKNYRVFDYLNCDKIVSLHSELFALNSYVNSQIGEIQTYRSEDKVWKLNMQNLENFTRLSDRMIGSISVMGETLFSRNKELKDFFSKVDSINSIYSPALIKLSEILKYNQQKDYPQVIYQSYSLLNDHFYPILAKHKKEETDFYSRNKKLVKGIVNSKDEVLKYGLFVSSIAIAEASEDVTAAIEAFALPAGSHRIKKEAYFSVGLNAYLGYANGVGKYNQMKGFTAPLGINANYGLGKAGGVSVSAYIIDVGAIVTSKLDSTAATYTSEFTWGNLFSPGWSVSYNLPILLKYSIPVTIGYSRQWGPEWTGFSTGGNIFSDRKVHNKIFIAFDIPITNFFVSNKSRKNSSTCHN